LDETGFIRLGKISEKQQEQEREQEQLQLQLELQLNACDMI